VTWLAVVIIWVIAVIASGFFSGSETGLYRLNRGRLRLRMDRREPRALALAGVLEDEQAALATTLIGTNMMNFVATAAVAYLMTHEAVMSDSRAELYTTLVVTPILFVFGEVVPKSWYEREADRLMYLGAWPLRASHTLFRVTGLIWLLGRLTSIIAGVAAGSQGSSLPSGLNPRRRMAVMLRDAVTAESANTEHAQMIDRVLNLSVTPVHSAMIPRNRVVSLPASADRSALVSIARRKPFSRFPIHDGDDRRIIGIADIHELLADTSWKRVGDKIHRPHQLDPHQTVATGIVSMQKAGHSMAIVADRRGRALGIVTLKDLLEEIVGDLPAW